MKLTILHKKNDIILELSTMPDTHKEDLALLTFISRLLRGVESKPFDGEILYLGLSGLITQCSWVNAVSIVEPPEKTDAEDKKPDPEPIENPNKIFKAPDGEKLHYVTVKDSAGLMKMHLVCIDEAINTKKPAALAWSKRESIETVCSRAVFNDSSNQSVIYSGPALKILPDGVTRCASCLARAAEYLN